MLDIKFIRENQDKVREICQKRQVNVDIKKLLSLYQKRNENLRELELIRAEKNKATREISKIKEKKEKESLISRMRKLDKKEQTLKETLKKTEEEFNKLMALVPNILLEEVPIGKDETENVIVRQVGKKTTFSFKPKSYLELSQKLDLIDIKRAVKIAGARFAYLKREAVFIEFALINLVFNELTKEGFVPVLPPVMIRPEMAWGMGYLEQEDKKEAYFLPIDNLYLAGTSEQTIGTMHANEIFREEELPKRYLAFSTCFRREAGSYGKDTKGIFRVHQFDKIEMFSFCKPEDSQKEHKFLLAQQEKLMKLLKIPYQVVKLCSGDLARPSAMTYDIEAWFPSENRYRETHSASNCTDFQARRLNIRYRRNKDKKLYFVHTLNATAFAIGRILIAIIENYQQKDGSIKVPPVLQKYLGNKKRIPWLERD